MSNDTMFTWPVWSASLDTDSMNPNLGRIDDAVLALLFFTSFREAAFRRLFCSATDAAQS
jgi:hypothetical protein